MRKLILMTVMILLLSSLILYPSSCAFAQTNEVTLADGVTFAADAVKFFPDGLANLDSAWIRDADDNYYIDQIALYLKGDSVSGFVGADCSLRVEVGYSDGYDTLFTILPGDSGTILEGYVDDGIVLWTNVPSDTSWCFNVPYRPHTKRRYKVIAYDEIKLYLREVVSYRQPRQHW